MNIINNKCDRNWLNWLKRISIATQQLVILTLFIMTGCGVTVEPKSTPPPTKRPTIIPTPLPTATVIPTLLPTATPTQNSSFIPFDCSLVSEIPISECETLKAIYNISLTQKDDWKLKNWFSTKTPCFWEGVSCANGRITTIDLTNTGLSGEFPAEIGNLTNLESLTLRANQLTTIPPEIGTLAGLVELNLELNRIKELPSEIGNLSDLHSLYLNDNHLKTLPEEIGNLTNLKSLIMSRNPLESWPSTLSNLTDLKSLEADELCSPNDPTVSDWIDSVPNLRAALGKSCSQIVLDFDCTLLNSEILKIPVEECEVLTTFYYISSNKEVWGSKAGWYSLSTPCSWEDIDCNDGHITSISLGGAGLSGSLPPEIGNLTQLQTLNLNNNQLTNLPPEIGNLTNLQGLYVVGNQWQALPAELGNLKSLKYVSVSDNQFERWQPILSKLENLKWLGVYSPCTPSERHLLLTEWIEDISEGSGGVLCP